VIAVAGHGDLAPWTLALLEEDLRARLDRFTEAGWTGLVRAGQGLPLVFGRAARKAGLALVTVLPGTDRVPDPLREGERRAAGELLMLSGQVRLLEYDPANRDACVRAERLLGACVRVLAVWDGFGGRQP
jgi:hypothetical protein